MKTSGNSALPRRRFLQQLMVLGGVTSAGTLIAQGMEQPAASPTQVRRDTARKGYRLTQHIRTYYAKAQQI